MATVETLTAAHQLQHLQPKIEALWSRQPTVGLTTKQLVELAQYPGSILKAVLMSNRKPNHVVKSGSWPIPETPGSLVSLQPIIERVPAAKLGFQDEEIGQTEQLYHSWESPEGTPWSVTLSKRSHSGKPISQVIIAITQQGAKRTIVQACI